MSIPPSGGASIAWSASRPRASRLVTCRWASPTPRRPPCTATLDQYQADRGALILGSLHRGLHGQKIHFPVDRRFAHALSGLGSDEDPTPPASQRSSSIQAFLTILNIQLSKRASGRHCSNLLNARSTAICTTSSALCGFRARLRAKRRRRGSKAAICARTVFARASRIHR